MNCKPGDLAVQVGGLIENHGLLLRVIKTGDYIGEWECEAMSNAPVSSLDEPIKVGEIVYCHDRNLRPLRDPGEDATDETLQWLPVPSRETESA